MAKQQRMPKADYFRKRYADALKAGLTDKAKYFKSRLEKLGEPLVITQHGKLTRSEFFDGAMIIYSW